MRQEAQFHPRRVEDIPSTPSTFPRNCWLSWEAFGFPPFGHYQYHYQACWAAREASKTWSRVLGKPTEVDCEGTVLADRKKAERPDETIDDTCFMLAVFDKVFEASWFDELRRAFQYPNNEKDILEWYEDTDADIEDAYETACQVLAKTPRRSQPPPAKEDVLWFCRDALDTWYDELDLSGDLPPMPADVPPFPISVLGRFAAKYFTHTHIVYATRWQTRSGEEVPGDASKVWLETKAPETAPPGPWQTVAEAKAYTKAGYDIFAKYRYRIELDSYLDELELARERALAATSAAPAGCPAPREQEPRAGTWVAAQ